jgi:subfamily B ATP-binding cassette protein MsbA
MKTIRRILQYSPRPVFRLVTFFLFAVMGVLFGNIGLAAVIPMLDVLFIKVDTVTIPVVPPFALSTEYFIGLFQHNFQTIIANNGSSSALLFVCCFILFSRMLGGLFLYLERITASKLRIEVSRNLRNHIFGNITLLHIGFFNSSRRGDLISRYTSDVQEIDTSINNGLKTVLKEPVAILVTFAMLFMISVKFTLIAMIMLPIVGGVIGTLVRQLKKKATKSQEAMGRIVNILDETFAGMRVIKAFNARHFIMKKMHAEILNHARLNFSISRKNELAAPVSEILGTMVIATIIYMGGSAILSGDESLSSAQFLGFLTFFATLIQPAKSFSQGITSMQKGMASAQRIFSIIDTPPVIENKPNAIELKSFERNIEFKNMSFAYERELVLKKINLTIEKGKTYALVGQSGGGKSTLADLVPRFYDPTGGDITLDGVSLRDYEIESLRKQIGVVTQESILFNDTIFNNIAFGMPHATETAVIEAAKVANAHDFITQTENGYQTIIGERGSKLSGGQRQRLSIARAVLKNPPILILDEATSALDSESEKLVQQALFNLMEHRTSLVIAHRLSTIQHANEILVINEGIIAERGTHDALIAKNGIYKKLNDIQKTVEAG